METDAQTSYALPSETIPEPRAPRVPSLARADRRVEGAGSPGPTLAELRAHIDQVDRELMAALARRAELARAVSRMKRVGGMLLVDPAREAVIVRRAVGRARELRIPDEEVRDLAWRTLALCRRAQEGGGGSGLP